MGQEYQPAVVVKVFSIDELLVLPAEKAIPENIYMTTRSGEFHFDIEAQIWECDLLDSLDI